MQYKQKHVFIIFGCALILVCIVLFVNVNALTPQKAQIVFISSRDQNCEIYVMDVDGKNQRSLTDRAGYPNWFDPDFIYAVSSAGKFVETWGWIKHN